MGTSQQGNGLIIMVLLVTNFNPIYNDQQISTEIENFNKGNNNLKNYLYGNIIAGKHFTNIIP